MRKSENKKTKIWLKILSVNLRATYEIVVNQMIGGGVFYE